MVTRGVGGGNPEWNSASLVLSRCHYRHCMRTIDPFYSLDNADLYVIILTLNGAFFISTAFWHFKIYCQNNERWAIPKNFASKIDC